MVLPLVAVDMAHVVSSDECMIARSRSARMVLYEKRGTNGCFGFMTEKGLRKYILVVTSQHISQ